jgi:hypothetical protein
MDMHILATPETATYAFGALSMAFGAYLAAKGWSIGGAPVKNAVSAAALLSGLRDRDTSFGYSRTGHAYASDDQVRTSLRLPVTMAQEGPGSVPEGILRAYEILCDALEHPDAPHPLMAAFMAECRGGGTYKGFREGLAYGCDDGAASKVRWKHAWWETVLLDLMIQCRARGSWISAADLDPFLSDRPDIAAALRAGRDGTVAPVAAGIVAHWQAEEHARWGIRIPRTAPGVAAIERKAS